MLLDGNAGSFIELGEAKNLVGNFSDQYPGLPKAYTIDAALVQELLEQPGCAGIRIYNGYNNEDQSITPVIVGVDDDNKDMLAGRIIDRALKCPNVPSSCPKGPSLFDQ